MSENKEKAEQNRDKPTAYKRPELTRWGTLRELTEGGGGLNKEPITKRKTRF